MGDTTKEGLYLEIDGHQIRDISLEMTEYPGTLEGDQRIIHQSLTVTICHYDNFECTPTKNLRSHIVWQPLAIHGHFFAEKVFFP